MLGNEKKYGNQQGNEAFEMSTPWYVSAGVLVGSALALVASKVVSSRKKTKERAICVLDEKHSKGVTGTITLTKVRDRTLAECDLHGLTPGLHGLHVHHKADFSGGCATTCSHYNPTGASHGGPTGPNRHKGDFGNLAADESGRSVTTIVADVRLSELVGRAFIVHADPDDLGQGGDEESRTTGNAGERIACGKIVWIA